MNFVIDERVKYRLTGAFLIAAVAIVFLPAMMKTSNQHLEENISVSLKLPIKPTPPIVAIPKKSVMFESVKVAHVELPVEPSTPQLALASKAVSLTKPITPTLARVEPTAKPVANVIAAPQKVAVVAADKKLNTSSDVYGVQLASFSQQTNAEYLVNRLRKQGYAASFSQSSNKQGQLYKVVVGALNKKDEAINLQKKLASNMQLNGFVIKTGVS